jgi:hypothetical protein
LFAKLNQGDEFNINLNKHLHTFDKECLTNASWQTFKSGHSLSIYNHIKGESMAHPLYHAKSSVKKYGGVVEDYLPIHNWFDESKAFIADMRHRALRHHAEGIFMCEKIFGISITNSDGRVIPVRFIGEQHVMEDLGRIPTVSDWLSEMPLKGWMGPRSQLTVTLDPEDSVGVKTPESLSEKEKKQKVAKLVQKVKESSTEKKVQ